MAQLFAGPTVKSATTAKTMAKTAFIAWANRGQGLCRRLRLARRQTGGSSARGKPMRENGKHITRGSSDEAPRLQELNRIALAGGYAHG